MVNRNCRGCNLPPPADYCWENRLLDCWMDMPPRDIDSRTLWRLLRELNYRIKALEERSDDD